MDFEIDMLEKPVFNKTKKGKGIVDDVKNFIKKHKKVLGTVAGATTGALGALALGALASRKGKRGLPSIEAEKQFNFLNTINKPEEVRILPFDEESKRPSSRRSSLIPNIQVKPVPQAVPIHSLKIREDIKNPFGLEGFTLKPHPPTKKLGGKKNSLLKQVQEYKKKHGCTLKEAWAAVKAKHGNGIFDKVKEFAKKHKKKIGAVAGALGTAGALATAAALGHREYKKNKLDKEIAKYLDTRPYTSETELLHNPTWTHLAEEYNGSGILDKAKEFLKKHKKKIGAVATGLAGTAAAAAIGKKIYDFKKDKEAFDKAQEQGKANEYERQAIRELLHRPPTQAEINQHLKPWWEHEPALPDGLNPFSGGKKMLPNPMNPETGLWEGYEKPLCRCGNDSDKILHSLGGAHLGKLILKHPKHGYGLVSDLHKGITKGFNFLGGLSLDVLIEIAVKLVGEPSRKPITRLVKKYGWQSIAVIKKYAHKGLTAIKNALKTEMIKSGKGCCSECKSHLEKEFVGGRLNYKKYGAGFWDDVGNYVFGALHRVGDVIQGVIPGTIGKAIAYIPKQAGKMGELVAPNYKFKDPYTLGDGMHGGSSIFEKIIDLIPFELLGEAAVEKARHSMGFPSAFDRRKVKKGGKEIPPTIKKIGALIPWEILTEILAQYLNIPDYGVIPEDKKLNWGRGKSEGMAHILPYYPAEPTQNPNMNESTRALPKNKNSDYKSFEVGMKKLGKGRTGGKSKKSGKGRTGGKAKVSKKKKITKKAISKKLKFKL